MNATVPRMILLACALGGLGEKIHAQTSPGVLPVEPGLETALRWKWNVVPSDPKNWPRVANPSTPEVPVATPVTPTELTEAPPPEENPPYIVVRGDRLTRIADRFGLTVNQLKTFNGLKTDLILVGQELKIPTAAQARAIEPLPEPKRAKKTSKSGEITVTIPEDLSMRVYLDRSGFSAGPLNAIVDPDLFFKMMQLYISAYPEHADVAVLKEKARAAVGDGLTTYKLKETDFLFISPPKLIPVAPIVHAGKPKNPPPPPKAAPITYQELVLLPMLKYRTPWEFVAEKFHCEEEFLRSLNPQIQSIPEVGTELRVPNVHPFEIEKALEEPLQPKENRDEPVTAAVFDLQLLAIYKKEKLIALMPLAMARPGLKGQGAWTILNAMPRPRLATLRETKPRPPTPTPMFGSRESRPTPAPSQARPTLSSEEFLSAGPNNPVGILWIDLAKANSTEPLPYGLHGTSLPDKLRKFQSIGGLQLSNWDIARAVRLLPPGTKLEWKQSATKAVVPSAEPQR